VEKGLVLLQRLRGCGYTHLACATPKRRGFFLAWFCLVLEAFFGMAVGVYAQVAALAGGQNVGRVLAGRVTGTEVGGR
jgi:hypothetical protein